MNESNIAGISARALIAMFLVLTVCIMSILKIAVTEPVYTLVVMAVSFYLGKGTTNVPTISQQIDKIENKVNGGGQ